MSEWGVVGVIVTLAGIFITVGKPVISLTKTIQDLNNTCSRLDLQFRTLEMSNKDSHRRLWEHNTKQDETITEHEQRITLLEMEGNKNET
ncbi:MAG: hypothetical protein KHZ62_02205 [Clostridiales bacterium]|nr:hypothetical protein [Clostridiales bacterium]